MSTTPISAYVVNSAATGRGWFVNELTGNDANNGSSLSPFATLDAALSAARVNTNDVVHPIDRQLSIGTKPACPWSG